MTRARIVGAIVALVVVALVAWRWFGRSPLEAEDAGPIAAGDAAAAVPAAVGAACNGTTSAAR